MSILHYCNNESWDMVLGEQLLYELVKLFGKMAVS